MEEIWKDIEGYEELYQVSNLGRVRSLVFKNNKIIKKRDKPLIMKYSKRAGYYIVNLRNNGKRKSFQIHRLVAETFIKKEKNKNIVNHKDYNKLNNNVDNLEWTNQKENVNWSVKNMKHSKKCKNKLNEQYIRRKGSSYELTLKKKYVGTYKTLEEAIKVKKRLINGDDYYK